MGLSFKICIFFIKYETDGRIARIKDPYSEWTPCLIRIKEGLKINNKENSSVYDSKKQDGVSH